MGNVTNKTLLSAVKEIDEKVVELRLHVTAQNGHLAGVIQQTAENREALKALPSMLTELALLKSTTRRQGKNWDRVLNVIVAVLQAGLIIWLSQLAQRLSAAAAALQRLP